MYLERHPAYGHDGAIESLDIADFENRAFGGRKLRAGDG
jgi:hypothetical protein